MNDLQQSQIQSNCRLALPEGLQDLMSDISREVLRAQPKHLLKFITEYLSALLVTRENLATATRVCDDICTNPCAKGLEDDLLEMGISEEDIITITKILDDGFEKIKAGELVKEGPMISKIISAIATDRMYDILMAVRRAFVRHQAYNTTIYEMTPDSSMDDITRAAHHTVDLYRKTKPTKEELHAAAKKIQAAYRAFGVTRQKTTEKTRAEWSCAPEVDKRAELEPKGTDDGAVDATCKRRITFEAEENNFEEADIHYAESNSALTNSSGEQTDDIYVAPYRNSGTESSISLAGSFIILPKDKPYSNIDDTIIEKVEPENDEGSETVEELFNFDYTKECRDTFEVTEALGEMINNEPNDFEPDDEEESIEEAIDENDRITDGQITDHNTSDDDSDEVIVDKTEYSDNTKK